MNKQKWTLVTTGVVGALVVLGIIIVVNIILGQLRLRKDFTSEQLYTLSAGTQQLLKNLPQEVTLKFYFSRHEESLVMPLKNYAQRIEDLLREYVSHSGGKVALEVFDPEPDSEAEEWAQRYGLMGQSLGMLGDPAGFYLGLVAVAGAREAAIPFLAPSVEPQLEYLVTRLLSEVIHAKKPMVGVMSPLPVMPPAPFMARQARSSGWFVVEELKKQYEVRSLPPSGEAIPDDIDLLVLIHPKQLSDEALFALDQFVLRGGRLMAFMDPLCLSDDTEQEGMMGMPPMGASDLNKLTKAWGVEMSADVVYDLSLASPVNFGNGRAERLPSWLTLSKANASQEDTATGFLEKLMMPFAGALTGAPVEGLKMTPLLTASPAAKLVSAMEARMPDAARQAGGREAPGAILAARLQGKFKTAFPDGKPVKPDAAATNAAPAETWLKESAKETAVILISDADMLNNDYCVSGLNIFGQTLYQPMNDNLNLALNMSEQMTGDEALIGLRSRGTYDRPFDRVVAMEREAQERWQQEATKLQEKLNMAQARINELQAGKQQGQEYILSPAQKAEIEQFRKERFETQRQLKEVRKNLRWNIESLGLKLKVINLFAIPLLVALFGIYHGWKRRSAV